MHWTVSIYGPSPVQSMHVAAYYYLHQRRGRALPHMQPCSVAAYTGIITAQDATVRGWMLEFILVAWKVPDDQPKGVPRSDQPSVVPLERTVTPQQSGMRVVIGCHHR